MGLDIKALMSYHVIVIYKIYATSFKSIIGRRVMSGRSTVSAVIPKMSREVLDIFIEPVAKRFDVSCDAIPRDAPERAEDNSK
jgi:hypothetical protein